jgi:hypothetical protein
MKSKKRVLLLAALLLAALAAWPLVTRSKQPDFVAEADLKDGRILRVEKVSFGKKHVAGRESLVIRTLGPWLPTSLRQFFEPVVPRNEITSLEDELVIWVNAIKPDTKTNIDCQGIRVDLIAEDGTIYGDSQPHWFGGERFWRVGHVFRAFPRSSKTLQMNVTTWRGSNTVQVSFANPAYTTGEKWTGSALPLTNNIRDAQIILRSLSPATNEAKYWKAASPYWKPEFEIWWKGQRQEHGWDLEWMGEDRYGNKGQQLGIVEPVLKFTATLHPNATNLPVALLLSSLPPIDVQSTNAVFWNSSLPANTNTVTVLGFFPAGVHTFSEGEYLTNPPVKFAPVRGGAPSGWVSQSRRVTPSRTESFHGHYSDVPVIYVRVSNPQSKERIGMRLIAPDGSVHLAEPEPQGTARGVLPFLLKVPAESTNVRPELVFLPAFEAEYLVNTTGSSR